MRTIIGNRGSCCCFCACRMAAFSSLACTGGMQPHTPQLLERGRLNEGHKRELAVLYALNRLRQLRALLVGAEIGMDGRERKFGRIARASESS
eukprot:6079915-Pleurochrysis_carterae.AAC.1